MGREKKAISAEGRVRSMEIYRNGVAVLVLPETAKCMADDKLRSPQDIEICPLGNCECDGDCDCYTE